MSIYDFRYEVREIRLRESADRWPWSVWRVAEGGEHIVQSYTSRTAAEKVAQALNENKVWE